MFAFSLDEVNLFVLRKQHLTDDTKAYDILQITRDISGLHGTGTFEPYLALFARTKNFDRKQLDSELCVKRSLAKIRCMRGTLYIMTHDMVPVAFAATHSMVEKLSVSYSEFRGVSQDDYSRLSKTILSILHGREMTIHEIKKRLATNLSLPAVLNLMCDQGLLSRVLPGDCGKSKNYRYALFQEYYKDIELKRFSEDEALALLVESYLRSFGPATENDVSWWVGLPKARIKKALQKLKEKTIAVSISDIDGDFLMLRTDLDLLKMHKEKRAPTVNFLPDLDPYLMGYRERNRYLQPARYEYIFDRTGNATSTILIDGKVEGVWDYAGTPEPQIRLFFFQSPPSKMKKVIEDTARELGIFISDTKASVSYEPEMVPLTSRSAGAFMSPLKKLKSEGKA